ncbi:MAG: putative quinol monooxygenase [Actinomycetes bacterium]
MTYALTGAFRATPGDRDALAAHLLHAAELLQTDPRCLLYAVGTTDEPDEVAVVELWTDAEAHAASLHAPGVGALVAVARPLIAGTSFRHEVTVLGGKGLPDDGGRPTG